MKVHNKTSRFLKVDGPAPHILIVEARFYDGIADELVAGAIAALDEAGATWERLEVPGAFEIPGAIAAVENGVQDPEHPAHFDGYVALGCVIRGETSHYDYVCGESARGLNDLALFDGCALGNGILTVDTEAQAWARANRSEGDKGRSAVEAALTMVNIKRKYAVPA